eukprot:360772-Chlamydomonas_euryale.AAC.12
MAWIPPYGIKIIVGSATHGQHGSATMSTIHTNAGSSAGGSSTGSGSAGGSSAGGGSAVGGRPHSTVCCRRRLLPGFSCCRHHSLPGFTKHTGNADPRAIDAPSVRAAAAAAAAAGAAAAAAGAAAATYFLSGCTSDDDALPLFIACLIFIDCGTTGEKGCGSSRFEFGAQSACACRRMGTLANGHAGEWERTCPGCAHASVRRCMGARGYACKRLCAWARARWLLRRMLAQGQ